ncbi:uncharacterized protein PGTG_11566 [Puccinia graminis f. sp. tritici CRL 75-36-700-3]|uniref:Uncharacterized protein n=1 Tax=Puccinia graminis f. sp. tritici (strain CRL 75-36-700-3 / race SCCL) TaxID=418459 RepID=E3KM48_PUCGT|nr:uncharacterized protein PGTG_11566 [Puccinia graminis f. sp. tritici CRL 75-36-700-3]EFP85397.1 hypothetical protein PGTG_11566 [Puccinia graminis f. sp. tritici CRL 75-36-700-3]
MNTRYPLAGARLIRAVPGKQVPGTDCHLYSGCTKASFSSEPLPDSESSAKASSSFSPAALDPSSEGPHCFIIFTTSSSLSFVPETAGVEGSFPHPSTNHGHSPHLVPADLSDTVK